MSYLIVNLVVLNASILLSILVNIVEYLLPSIPDLRALRELTVSPYLRSQMKVSESVQQLVSLPIVHRSIDCCITQLDLLCILTLL